MPLVNRYLASPSELATELRFPLQIAYCEDCWLSQLTWVVAPEILYSDYAYHSSVSLTFRDHCREMASSLVGTLGLSSASKVLEIASNDGCLQRAFREAGIPVLGVEPAANLAGDAIADGLPVINEFWNLGTAEKLTASDGLRDLIIATNVLAHVDDLDGFFRAVSNTLGKDGVFVFEVPYLTTFLTRTEFDTTYHEHLSYFLLNPLNSALARAGLEIHDVREFDIHGGSIRVQAGPPGCKPVSVEVPRMLQLEKDFGFLDPALYSRFTRHVEAVREELTLFLHALKERNRTIAAYGASAKGNVLLNYCGFGPDLISYIADDTSAKQGLFAPGCGIPIVPRSMIAGAPPDYLLLLAWNFSEELMRNIPDFSVAGGRFIVPIPALRVV